MFKIIYFICYYFVHLSTAFHGNGGLIRIVFGLQRLCLCRCGFTHNDLYESRGGRLLGGESMVPHQFPWLAQVHTGSLSFTGTLISDRHVITAATPLYGVSASQVTVTLAGHDVCGHKGGDAALNSSVSAILLHPAYSTTIKDNDIAMLRLRHIVPFSQFVSPICLPFAGTQESGKVAWTASWKQNEDGASTCVPRSATLPILPAHTCLKATPEAKLVTPDKGCLGPIGAKSIVCKVDVGAPVMMRSRSGTTYRLAGVMSPVSECEERHAPLYTRVSDHLIWIYDNIRVLQDALGLRGRLCSSVLSIKRDRVQQWRGLPDVRYFSTVFGVPYDKNTEVLAVRYFFLINSSS